MRRYGRPRKTKNFRILNDVKLKTCTRCEIEMIACLDNFSLQKKGAFGFRSMCKPCWSQYIMERNKITDPTNERVKAWRRKNREKHNEYAKTSRLRRNADSARLGNHRKWVREYCRTRRSANPQLRFLESVRTQINMIVRGRFDGRGLLRRLGYSREELITHIERQFSKGMSWDNYGGRCQRHGWEIDHIRPCALFDLSNEDEFRECWSLTNLRPLWSVRNRSKGAKLELLL